MTCCDIVQLVLVVKYLFLFIMDPAIPRTSKGYVGSQTVQNVLNFESDSSSDEYIAGDSDVSISASDDESSDAEVTAQRPLWSISSAGMRPIEFRREEGLLVPLPGEGMPIDYFNLMLDEVLLENICNYTNENATNEFFKPTVTPKSRIHSWRELKVPELKIFLGLLFHTGTIQMNRIQDYWKKDPLFNINIFSKFMGRDRFLSILRYLYFYKPPNVPIPNETRDPLAKISNIIDYFNNKMLSIYSPQRELLLDEAMVLWRGRLRFRQYIKGKGHKYGMKLYTLTEPHGLILKFCVYGRSEDVLAETGHTEKVVLYLLKEHLNKGHAIYMDDYYNSVVLASILLSKKTYCTGPLCMTRKFCPPEVKTQLLPKGQTLARYADGVMIGKWRDRRYVSYISTEHENEMVEFVDRRGHSVKKPLPIVKYNAFMKGVDRSDQLMSYYPCEQKSIRWYKKLFVHILQMILLNSHVLYNKYSMKKMSFYEFRLGVIRSLLPPIVPKIESPAQKRLRLATTHKAEKITDNRRSESQGNRLKRKKCRVCFKNGKKTATSAFYCPECPDKPGLCVNPCFDIYHNNL
uniref:Uncharacterized protein n=1 Tax=Clastoptera arizonana TaxID=38151 RepID=A0A1B6DFG4_9HEMI